MKNLLQIISLFSLLLSVAQVGFRHDEGQPLPANPKFKHHRKIFQLYDPASDQTRILLEEINLHSAGRAGIESVVGIGMGVFFIFPGKTVRTPQEVTLGFTLLTTIPVGKYPISVKADDEVLLKGIYQVKWRQSFGRDVPSGRPQYYLVVEVPITYEKFQQMVNAMKVKIKVGSIDDELSKEEMESLRDLASKMNP